MNQYTSSGKYVESEYVWGDLLKEQKLREADLRVINLETSVTTSNDPMEGKPVLYKMHPQNLSILKEAKIDFVTMANNHTFDWSEKGLNDTISSLDKNRVAYAGIAKETRDIFLPKILQVNEKKVHIYCLGDVSSGMSLDWIPSKNKAGVAVVNVKKDSDKICEIIKQNSEGADLVIVSIHFGPNWGFQVSESHANFAHKIIDEAKVSIVHGHSSHHFKPIEIYKQKLILYGCGDLINDYEVIDNGYEEKYLSRFSLAYFPEIDLHNGNLKGLEITVYRMKNLRLEKVEKFNNIVNKLNEIGKSYNSKFIKKGGKIKLVL